MSYHVSSLSLELPLLSFGINLRDKGETYCCMQLPIVHAVHGHHIVEVGIVEFRAFYYLCKIFLQHAAKISCGIALKFKAFLLPLQGKIAACCKNIL